MRLSVYTAEEFSLKWELLERNSSAIAYMKADI
jgi:hypothetical protein